MPAPCMFLDTSCSSLEILLPAFIADGAFFLLPGLQISDRDPIPTSKGLPGQTRPASPCPNTAPLSILEELIEFVQKIQCRDAEETGQSFPHLLIEVMGDTFFNGFICIRAHTDLLRHLRLQQPHFAPEPTEPVRNILDIIVASVAFIYCCGFPPLPRFT